MRTNRIKGVSNINKISLDHSMEDKGGLSRRRKSIMVIDKKGKAQEVLKQSRGLDDSKIKEEEKGEKSINSPGRINGMGEKECKCEMCTKEGYEECKGCPECVKGNEDKEERREDEEDGSSILNGVGHDGSEKDGHSENQDDSKEMTTKDEHQHETTTKDDDEDHKVIATATGNYPGDVHADDPNTNLKTKAGVATTGAVVGAGPGIVLGKSAEEEKKIQELKMKDHAKKVSIDESRNKEYSVPKDGDKSIPLSEEEKFDGKTGHVKGESLEQLDSAFIPPSIPAEQLPGDSEILKERENDNVVCEGHMWKRRRIFACFWHEKYFLLTKEGVLKYHKANGTKYSKGNWNLKNVNRIHEVFIGTESHPYRLALICDTENLLFGYDDPDTREFWYNQFSKFIDF